MEYETKCRLRRCVSVSVRAYLLGVLVTVGYGVFWLFDLAGLIDGRPSSSAWVGVLAMGGLFLVLLVPVFRETRTLAR